MIIYKSMNLLQLIIKIIKTLLCIILSLFAIEYLYSFIEIKSILLLIISLLDIIFGCSLYISIMENSKIKRS